MRGFASFWHGPMSGKTREEATPNKGVEGKENSLAKLDLARLVGATVAYPTLRKKQATRQPRCHGQ